LKSRRCCSPVPTRSSSSGNVVHHVADGLQQLGWADGRNVRIDIRWTAGNPADADKYAADLVALTPDVIFDIAKNLASQTRLEIAFPRRTCCGKQKASEPHERAKCIS
jgi:hypothetical protein